MNHHSPYCHFVWPTVSKVCEVRIESWKQGERARLHLALGAQPVVSQTPAKAMCPFWH